MRFGIKVKILIFAAVVWAFIFGAYSLYIYKDRIEQTRRMALTTAKLLARQIAADRQFYTSTVVKRALDAGMLVVDAYHSQENSIPLPSTYLREVAETLETSGGFYMELSSLNPINPTSAPSDTFQREALSLFSEGSDTIHYAFENYRGKDSLRYMVPDIAASETCVDCHNTFSEATGKVYKIGDVLGGIEIVVPIESEMSAAMAYIWRSIGYGFAVVLTMAFVGLAFIRRVITGPIFNVLDTTKYLAEGDLTVRASVTSDDEIGDLAVQTNEVVANLHTMIEDIRLVTDDALDISSTVKEMSRVVLDGSNKQGASIDSIISSMEGVNTLITEIAKATDVLASSVEKGSSSVLELDASVNEVVDNTESLFVSVDETARSTKDMSSSIKVISENIENLSSAITQVSSSMSEINASIKEVETNASEGNRFADEVISDARAGMKSVESTIGGMVKIKETTREGADSINNLCKRIQEIGQILDVIRDVAEETNILAINAAIIAAQSGEYGKSFSVVANEIKDLAERTTSSAKEVSEIIQAVEIESGRAGNAMERGVESVEEGVRLAVEAGEGLKKIVASAQRSTSSVREIARAAAEQAKGSRQAVEATEKVAEMTKRIANSAREQARGSELINKASERMSEIAYKVKGSTRAQVEANEQIKQTMDDVSRMVTHINKAIGEQSRNIVKVLERIASVRNVSVEHIEKAVETKKAAEEMVMLNSKLMEGVKRFKLKKR